VTIVVAEEGKSAEWFRKPERGARQIKMTSGNRGRKKGVGKSGEKTRSCGKAPGQRGGILEKTEWRGKRSKK